MDYEERLRAAAFAWLDHRVAAGQGMFTFADLAEFTFEGQPVPLMDRQRGIRKPAQLAAALSIRTTYTPPNRVSPYADAAGPDGLLRYKYRGHDPEHPENVALRTAFQRRLPLVWFQGAAAGQYMPLYPIWIVGDEPAQLQFVVAVDRGQEMLTLGDLVDDEKRRYVERLTRQRLHQPLFRLRVITAYNNRCAMCRLRHPTLLDAAHILPDDHPRGQPVVPNGLSLCKIHHAAFDQNMVGVRPDLVVDVRSDIRREIDGPMLIHGLQGLAGTRLIVPAAPSAKPDSERLEERYEEFLRAG